MRELHHKHFFEVSPGNNKAADYKNMDKQIEVMYL